MLEREHEIEGELNALMPEWLKAQPLAESWKYWVRRAGDYDLRIYYAGTDIMLVDWDSLEHDEKEQIREGYDRAAIRDVPDDDIIRAMIETCSESDLFS